ncbi:MAG: arginine--tRNA ligase [Chloroflexota bacterium]|nr:arginine--tRNA ligase [Chloroflexota bacterium]
MTVRRQIEQLLAAALAAAQADDRLPAIDTDDLGVERSRVKEADFSSTLPMRLARAVGAAPRDIAATIVDSIAPSPMLAEVSVAGPGFINFLLADAWLAERIAEILESGTAFGRSDAGAGRRVQVEFVSVNPTGPLTVGHGRGAVLGDVLARVLDATGHAVQREYYVNDSGNQVRLLGASMYSHYAAEFDVEVAFPAGGYLGDYVVDWARAIAAEEGRRFLELAEDDAVDEFTRLGIELALGAIREHLGELDIEFANWFHESELHAAGAVTGAIDRLRDRGHVAEREGAVWFVHGDEGDDSENVLVKRTGEPTYLTTDIAYHRNKFEEREFELVIDILGADHHGHAPRMHAAMDALGIPRERLTYLICQMVHVVVEGIPVKQSKRAGDFELFSQLVADVGPDATRYHMLARAADSQMEFDVDLARSQTEENPVHKIRYAHARIASILRKAADQKIDTAEADLSLLTEAPELDLIRTMLDYPELLDSAGRTLEPHHLPHFALNLAGQFNSYYHVHRVISEDKERTRARLQLVSAVKQVLANILGLMGITAPERMVREAEAEAETGA